MASHWAASPATAAEPDVRLAAAPLGASYRALMAGQRRPRKTVSAPAAKIRAPPTAATTGQAVEVTVTAEPAAAAFGTRSARAAESRTRAPLTAGSEASIAAPVSTSRPPSATRPQPRAAATATTPARPTRAAAPAGGASTRPDSATVSSDNGAGQTQRYRDPELASQLPTAVRRQLGRELGIAVALCLAGATLGLVAAGQTQRYRDPELASQ